MRNPVRLIFKTMDNPTRRDIHNNPFFSSIFRSLGTHLDLTIDNIKGLLEIGMRMRIRPPIIV